MNLSELLGLELKDDKMLEVLEGYGIGEVVYDFDRLNENTPDAYWAGSKNDGFLLRFNQHQVCDVVFCHVAPAEGYSEIDPEIIGVTTYPSYAAAEQACEQLQLKYSVAGPDMQGGWLRIDEGPFQTHFQFQDGALFRVTLSAHDAQ
ncbi:MAG TPA: hypothetical protein VFD64_11945 [Gemmatimonadaceae bacterium]|nr:hypothetical protein [Gemmatimonadaceae bacterium]